MDRVKRDSKMKKTLNGLQCVKNIYSLKVKVLKEEKKKERKEGRKGGRKEGRKEGREEGRKEGKKEGRDRLGVVMYA